MKRTSAQGLSKKLRISPARGMEAVIKAQLISAVIKAITKVGMTHAELAKRSGLSRSVVTGILVAEVKVKVAA